MADEANVKIRLDTRQAKGDLRGLTKEAKAAGGAVSDGVRTAAARGMGMLGLGAGIGGGIAAGTAALRGVVQPGFSDMGSTFFGGLTETLRQASNLGLSGAARGIKRAADDTVQTFAAIAGQREGAPPGWKNYFESLKTMTVNEEKGRDIMRKAVAVEGGMEMQKAIAGELGKQSARGYMMIRDLLLKLGIGTARGR